MKTFLTKHSYLRSPRNIIGFTICVFLLCAAIWSLIFPPQVASSSSQFQVKELGQLPPIEPGTVVTQTFEATDNFTGFGLLFANDTQVFEQGTLEITVLNQNNVVGACSIDLKNYTSLAFLYCELPLVNEQQYKLLISTKDTQLPVTFLTTAAQIDYATMAINDEIYGQLIIMDFLEKRSNYMLAWFFAVAANLVICYLVVNVKKEPYVVKKKR